MATSLWAERAERSSFAPGEQEADEAGKGEDKHGTLEPS